MSNELDIFELTDRARCAQRKLATSTSAQRNALLRAISAALIAEAEEILESNARDCERALDKGMAEGLVDRLRLNDSRVRSIAQSVLDVVGLEDPVGTIIRGGCTEDGLRVSQIRVPMGVVGMIYEARPNVTVDASILALKSGNAVILRGGSAALSTNETLVKVIRRAIESCGFSADLVQTVDSWGREGARAMMRARGGIDVLIPRGGAGLIRAVVEESTVPVIETGTGNCHVYVDSGADVQAALAIIMNAKTQRVGVCNAAETLLVHRDMVASFLPLALEELTAAGVTIHADEATRECAALGDLVSSQLICAATEEDWATEYLSMDLAVRVVDSIEEAVEHIRTYSSGHTEAICTPSLKAAHFFRSNVDSAAVAINASTRFTDGGQLGLGAEIGISTQKLHARGPMGLAELTTSQWIIEGDGAVRK